MYFTEAERESIKRRAKSFKVSMSEVVRSAASGMVSPIGVTVPKHGGIKRVMSLADKEDYTQFKRASSTLNEGVRRLGKIAKNLEEHGLQPNDLAYLRQVLAGMEQQAQDMTELARSIAKCIQHGPRS